MNKQNAWTVITSGVLAFFEPIAGNIFALAYVFAFNFLIGLITAMIAQGEKFNMWKALRCIAEAAIFFALCASVYVCGKMNGNAAGAISTVSLFVYIVLFVYSRNVLKNLRRLLKENTPAWLVVDFLYSVFSFEFIKSIPGLTNYIKMKEHENPSQANSQEG